MFKTARLKLTIYYTLIITVVIVIFSGFLFQLTNERLHQNVSLRPRHDNDPVYEELIEHLLSDLERNLIFSDLIVIGLASFLSYFLAGKTLKPIQEALDAQEQFSANASHELRTPLSILKTEFEVFQKKKSPSLQQMEKLIQSGLEEIDRMVDMTENLLILARSKKTEIDVQFAPINLSLVIDKVVNKISANAELKAIQIVVYKPNELYINGNERLLEQVFFNLLQNAITYTLKGNVMVNAQVKDNIQITIKDTGIGMSKEDLVHIFEPFYKADKSRTASSSGVGLGLYIVYEIMKILKGRIQVESELGRGTIVTLTFPQARPASS